MLRVSPGAGSRGRMFRRFFSADDGSAALEFVTAGMILLVPLVYLVLVLGALQGGALAVEGAARQAARVYVQAASVNEAEQRAERAVAFALADHGIDVATAEIGISCERESANGCLARSAVVTVTVRVNVALPLVPDVLDLSRAASVPVQAVVTQQVSRFWSAGR